MLYLLQRTMCAVPEEWQQVGAIVLSIQTNLYLMIFLTLVVVPLKQFM